MKRLFALILGSLTLSCGQKEEHLNSLNQNTSQSVATINKDSTQVVKSSLIVPTPFPGPEPTQLLSEINMVRKQRGLPELTINETLTCAASRHAWYIGPKNVCSSKGSDGSDLAERVRSCRGAATVEIIGCNYMSAKDAVNAWIQRPELSRYILNYNMVQVGVAEVNRHYVAVFLGML